MAATRIVASVVLLFRARFRSSPDAGIRRPLGWARGSPVPAWLGNMDNDKIEAIQAVVDRVSSYQDGATQGTVEDELSKGFGEAGVDVAAADTKALAEAIEARDGDVTAADVVA